MAEPLEWMAIAEGAYLVGEGVVALGEITGLIGAAAETAAVTTTVAEVAAGTTLVAETVGGTAAVATGLDAVGGAALGASTIGATEAVVGTGLAGAIVIGASEVASTTAGAATFESIFASAATEVGMGSEGVTGAEVVQGASWAERVGSLASRAGTVGKSVATSAATAGAAGVTVAKASPYIYTGGDVASRVMSGEGVGEAIVNTAGDTTKLGAKAVSFSIEELFKDIDPSILFVAGSGAYLYFSN